MRIRALTLRRAARAAAGLLAAGVLSGCRSGTAPFMYPGVARGDGATAVPASPAFARVAAGQYLAADPNFVPGTPTLVIPSGSATPTSDGQPAGMSPGPPLSSTQAAPGHPLVGSGGLVYPVAHSPGVGQAAMPAPPQVPVVMPFQAIPAMPAGPSTSGMAGQQMILLVNGPNGPQYVIAEVMGAAPAPMPTMAAPMLATTGAPIVPAATTLPAAMSSLPAPAATFAAGSAADALPAPTFNPPPPAVIPMPAMPPSPAPAVIPVEMSMKAPDPLPPTVGPVLPAPGGAVPAPGALPVAPDPGLIRAPKLPTATAVTDEEIPAAPVFLPAGK